MLRFLLPACFVFVACNDQKPAPPKLQMQAQAEAPTPVVAAAGSSAATEAKDIFNTRCSVCHGVGGKGDGAASAALNPKPRDMTDDAWQKSVTDEHLKKVIVEGGAAVGKSALMAANPDLKDKPEVVAELVKLVRSLDKK